MAKKKSAHQAQKKSKRSLMIIDVDPQKYFVMCNGEIIKDYRELANIMHVINDDVFHYHVNKERNDFSTWINDVFEERELADALRKTVTKTEFLMVLYKHLYEKLEKLCNH